MKKQKGGIIKKFIPYPIVMKDHPLPGMTEVVDIIKTTFGHIKIRTLYISNNKKLIRSWQKNESIQ